jgi:hypothetical protein
VVLIKTGGTSIFTPEQYNAVYRAQQALKIRLTDYEKMNTSILSTKDKDSHKRIIKNIQKDIEVINKLLADESIDMDIN